jgi:hypothetical protein
MWERIRVRTGSQYKYTREEKKYKSSLDNLEIVGVSDVKLSSDFVNDWRNLTYVFPIFLAPWKTHWFTNCVFGNYCKNALRRNKKG